jgi:hypothetical protein
MKDFHLTNDIQANFGIRRFFLFCNKKKIFCIKREKTEEENIEDLKKKLKKMIY